MPLGQSNFSAGWRPNDDFLTGNKNGQLRMDNLWLDEQGSISLVRGAAFIAQFGTNIVALFTQYVNGVKYRYIGFSTGAVLRDNGDNSFTVVIGNSGTGQFAFGSGFGEVFVSSGLTLKAKDSIAQQLPWGLNAPGGLPTVVVNPSPFIVIAINYTIFTAVEGTLLSTTPSQVSGSVDANTFRLNLQYIPASVPEDLTLFSDGGSSTDNDLFSLNVQIPDSDQLLSVRVEFLLQNPVGSTSPTQDYYYFEWDPNSTPVFLSGTNQWSTLNATRIQFQRQGNSTGLDWSSMQAVRVIFTLLEAGNCAIGNPFNFTGGSNAQLFGGTTTGFSPYTYQQVNVYNSGAYIGASPISQPTAQVTAIAASTTLTPYVVGIDSQVNEIWFYRNGGTLEVPYFCGKSIKSDDGSWPTVIDFDSDADILDLNLQPNIFLGSILTDISDQVIAIAGPANGRMVLLTNKNVIFTDYLNPESFDTRMVLTLSGAVGEVNLFMAKLGQATILVGTTGDIYQITGTFQQLPDGTFDVSISALGLQQPPISPAFAIKDNIIFYKANDGIKSLEFSIAQLQSTDLENLWRGQTRYGVAGYKVQPDFLQQQMVYYKGKLSTILPHLDGTIAVTEWDFGVTKCWYRKLPPTGQVPLVIYAEPDGTVLFALSDKSLRTFNSGVGFNQSNGTKILPSINLQFPATGGEEAFSRKDLFTLKLTMQGGPIDVYIVDENSNSKLAVTGLNIVGAMQVVCLAIENIPNTLNRRYSITIVDSGNSGVSYFKLADWSIDYLARPAEEMYNRTLPDNLGSPGRKRIFQYVVVVDTRNSPAILTPYVDGAPQPPLIFTTNDKSTVTYVFQQETIGVDIWHTIVPQTSTPIEYYGLDLSQCVTEKMPPLGQYLVIPQDNFGIPAKKRVRTLPFIINTFGQNVTYQPYVDGTLVGNAQIFNTKKKQTVFYYFTTDVFGVDYGGVLSYVASQVPPEGIPQKNQGMFEFYGFAMPPEGSGMVEILPVPKLFDQLGPYQLDKRGKLLEFRLRVLSYTTSINFTVFMDDQPVYSNRFFTTPGVDSVYEVKIPKSILGAVMRVELTSPDAAHAFYRWWGQFRVILSGMETGDKWVTVAGKVTPPA